MFSVFALQVFGMSCQGCTTRKIRCERREGHASCARCTKKGIACVTEKRATPSLMELVETTIKATEEAKRRAAPVDLEAGPDERMSLLRHVSTLLQDVQFKGSTTVDACMGSALPPESDWPSLKPQVLFRVYVRGAMLARMCGKDKTTEDRLLQAARPIANMLYDRLDDADVVLGFHLLSRLLLTEDTRLAMHVCRTACSMARALSNPAEQLASEEYKLATSMLQFTFIRLQAAGLPFSLSELEYVPHRPDPPVLDPSSPQSIHKRFQYEFFMTRVDLARCCSLVTVIFSKFTPSADLLQAPRIDVVPADAATVAALGHRCQQLTLVMDLVFKHKDELGIEGAWCYYTGLLHRLLLWCLLDRNDMAMNDLRHLALFFTRNEAVFGSIPNPMLTFHACRLPMVCTDEATFLSLLGIFKTRGPGSKYCHQAVPILEAAWNEYGAPTAAAISLASLASPLPPMDAESSQASSNTALITQMPASPEWNADWFSEPISNEGMDPLFALLLD